MGAGVLQKSEQRVFWGLLYMLKKLKSDFDQHIVKNNVHIAIIPGS